MKFKELYAQQIKTADTVPNATRSSKILIPMHSAIAEFVAGNSEYKTQSMPDKEFEAQFSYGTKKIDIALLDDEGNLKGAILFKGIKSEYNKNANNYYEQMKGESSLFIDNGIPVYQIILIPTRVHHKGGKDGFETPTEKSFNNYKNFIHSKPAYWDKLKLGVYYFDIDYTTYTAEYSTEKVIEGVEPTLTEGLLNFIEKVKKNG